MTTIKNYDSRLSLSNYEIGSVHSFCINTTRPSRLKVDPKKDFKEFVKILNEVIESNITSIRSNSYCTDQINIGVVVSQLKSSIPEFADQITVMFKNNTDEYILYKYPVHSKSVFR